MAARFPLPNGAVLEIARVIGAVAKGDLTRTMAIGEGTADQRRMFTLVLKGHIAMATVLREGVEAGLIAEYPRLAAYLDRCTARPAFTRAMDAQLVSLKEEPVAA